MDRDYSKLDKEREKRGTKTNIRVKETFPIAQTPWRSERREISFTKCKMFIFWLLTTCLCTFSNEIDSISHVLLLLCIFWHENNRQSLWLRTKIEMNKLNKDNAIPHIPCYCWTNNSSDDLVTNKRSLQVKNDTRKAFATKRQWIWTLWKHSNVIALNQMIDMFISMSCRGFKANDDAIFLLTTIYIFIVHVLRVDLLITIFRLTNESTDQSRKRRWEITWLR